MKLPTATLSLLVICSIVNGVPTPGGKSSTPTAPTTASQGPTLQAANNASKPSLLQKTKAAITGNATPKLPKTVITDSNTTNLSTTPVGKKVGVMNQDQQVFTVNTKKQIGKGAFGTVYQATNHSDPKAQTVMKVSTTPGSYVPGSLPKAPGESEKSHANRLQTAQKKAAEADHIHAKAAVDRENGYNQKMGISAGKPVAVSNGHVSTTYMPMKKVEGASLEQELYKGKGILGNKSYIPTHTLLSHAKAAINEANNNGINHNDAQPGNILVTKKGAKLIDYGSSTDRTSNSDRLGDHKILYDRLNDKKRNIPPTRMNSFNDAMALYKGQLTKAKFSPNYVVQ